MSIIATRTQPVIATSSCVRAKREGRGQEVSPPLFARVLCGSTALLAASPAPTGESDARCLDRQPAAVPCGLCR